MLTVTLAWAARHTMQPCVTTTRTGTVHCDHHSDAVWVRRAHERPRSGDSAALWIACRPRVH
jgi:hypothetical protein